MTFLIAAHGRREQPEGTGVSRGTRRISKTGSGAGERYTPGYSPVAEAPFLQSYLGELCD